MIVHPFTFYRVVYSHRSSEFTFDPFQDERLPPRGQVCCIAERPPGAPGYGPWAASIFSPRSP